MATDARGAGSFRDNTNTVFNFIATNDTIYQLTSGAFTDVGASGFLLNNSFSTCTITVSDYANITAGKTITLTKNNGTSVVFTSTLGSPAALEFQVQTNNNTTAIFTTTFNYIVQPNQPYIQEIDISNAKVKYGTEANITIKITSNNWRAFVNNNAKIALIGGFVTVVALSVILALMG